MMPTVLLTDTFNRPCQKILKVTLTTINYVKNSKTLAQM